MAALAGMFCHLYIMNSLGHLWVQHLPTRISIADQSLSHFILKKFLGVRSHDWIFWFLTLWGKSSPFFLFSWATSTKIAKKMFVAIWDFAPFIRGSPGSWTTILLIPKNLELRNQLPETKCDKSIHYLTISAGLSSIKHCNIAQGVTHPVTWTPRTHHRPVIYWLPGWRFTASRTN